jgi:predicted MPP superfamily phosphohydrolase
MADEKAEQAKMADQAAAASSTGAPTAKSQCCTIYEIEALILYPSLTLPQILPDNPTECTIIIATNSIGRSIFMDYCKGAVVVNHHLRLIDLTFDKITSATTLCPVSDWHLYSEVEDKYYEGNERNGKNGKMLRENYIEIRHLYLKENILRGDEGDDERKPIGILSTDALLLHQNGDFWSSDVYGFTNYFSITLKNLKVKPDATPKSWAWIVTTTNQHQFIGADGKPITKNLPKVHQPLDRLIYNGLQPLAKDYNISSGAMLPIDSLFEIPVEKGEYAPPDPSQPYRRVQAWHPVMTKPATHMLKLGHLTDSHISVRAATIGRSPAKVIESDKATAPYLGEVGKRVAHTFKSFKALVDAVKEKGADVLAITGDVIDFNRNLDPEHTKDKKTVKDVWLSLNAIANVYSPGGGYKRCIDQLYFYSLLMYALRDKHMPAYYVTGNHEGYQWPYGISPRVDDDVVNLLSTKAKDLEPGAEAFNFAGALDNSTENEKKAFLNVREKSEDRFRTDEERAKAEKKHQRKAQRHKAFLEDAIAEASAYHRKKATECIPSDHNLTIYEACLAYGPTYGQTLVSKNFRREQFNWIHWLYSPFTSFNAYPCCTDLFGDYTRGFVWQALTLLGWGDDEHMMLGAGWVAAKYIARSWVELGEDRRGEGFLPHANNSISPGQLQLLGQASRSKAKSWAVMSHFTIASYEDGVPASIPPKEAGFWPGDDVKSGFTKGTTHSQFNLFNWGGCEKGLKSYLNQYASIGFFALPGKVNLHLSGHSHRAGVYVLTKKDQEKGEFTVNIECKVPQIPGELGQIHSAYEGTRFVVGTTAGPMGKQALSGWDAAKRSWTATDPGYAFLGGWLTRPPSGLIVSMANEEGISYVKADKPQNDIPRLAVMLDYRDVMSIAEKTPQFRPFNLSPAYDHEHINYMNKPGYKPQNLENGFYVRLSDEMKALNCLKLNEMKVWVFKKGAAQATTVDGNDSSTVATPSAAAKGEWHTCKAWVEDSRIMFENKGQLLQDAIVPVSPPRGSSGVSVVGAVPCAFLEIPLQKPARPADVPWDEVKWEGESWVFPLDILNMAIVTRDPPGGVFYKTRYHIGVHRGEGESGEVPKWEFLAKHFGEKYPRPDTVIDPNKTSKTLNKTSNKKAR